MTADRSPKREDLPEPPRGISYMTPDEFLQSKPAAPSAVEEADVDSLLDWLEGRPSGGRSLTRQEAAHAVRDLARRLDEAKRLEFYWLDQCKLGAGGLTKQVERTEAAMTSPDQTLTHELKCQQPYFAALRSGKKTFEIRWNDRGFKEGDMLRLREYDALSDYYSGEECLREITYVTNWAQRDGFVVLGLRSLDQHNAAPFAGPDNSLTERVGNVAGPASAAHMTPSQESWGAHLASTVIAPINVGDDPFDWSEHWRKLAERHMRESDRYKALLFDAWKTMRGQAKGLKRQARKIKRLQERLKP